MQKITKAVIPVAGFGTRFLPATKALPKEMLPVVDKPIVQYAVEEAVASGIKDIILVTGRSKRAVEDHFDFSPELERWLEEINKKEILKSIRKISKLANFIYIRQKGPYGNGTPVLCAQPLIGNQPFVVIWADDLFVTKKPWVKQIIEVYQKYTDPVLSVYPVDEERTKKKGIMEGKKIEKGIFQVKRIIEKPGPKKTSSRLASLGGWVLTPDIFQALRETPLGKGRELWLVDAVRRLFKKRPIYAREIEGKYYDVGSKLGWLKANVELGLRHSEVKKEFRRYLKSIKL